MLRVGTVSGEGEVGDLWVPPDRDRKQTTKIIHVSFCGTVQHACGYHGNCTKRSGSSAVDAATGGRSRPPDGSLISSLASFLIIVLMDGVEARIKRLHSSYPANCLT